MIPSGRTAPFAKSTARRSVPRCAPAAEYPFQFPRMFNSPGFHNLFPLRVEVDALQQLALHADFAVEDIALASPIHVAHQGWIADLNAHEIDARFDSLDAGQAVATQFARLWRPELDRFGFRPPRGRHPAPLGSVNGQGQVVPCLGVVALPKGATEVHQALATRECLDGFGVAQPADDLVDVVGQVGRFDGGLRGQCGVGCRPLDVSL